MVTVVIHWVPAVTPPRQPGELDGELDGAALSPTALYGTMGVTTRK